MAATKLFLSLTGIEFAGAVSSRAVSVFPALSVRRVRPSYRTFSLMVFQGNCARGRTGHMINVNTVCFVNQAREILESVARSLFTMNEPAIANVYLYLSFLLRIITNYSLKWR